MKYILKNIILFKKNQPVFLVLIIVSVFITSIMINFSYGLYLNYRDKKNSEIDALRHLQIEINEDADLTKSNLEDCILHLPTDLEQLINTIRVRLEDNGVGIDCAIAVRDGTYITPAVYRDNLIKANFIDSYFTDKQEKNGDLVALCWDYRKANQFPLQGNNLVQEGDFLQIQGNSYQVIGLQTWSDYHIMLPFGSLNPETILDSNEGIYLHFNKAISKRQYDKLYAAFNGHFGDKIQIPSLPLDPSDNRSLYNTIMLISVCITIIAAINFAILFQYIMLQREKTLAVYRICGLRKTQAVLIYLSECACILVPVYALGSLTFHYLFLPVLTQFITYIHTAYTWSSYLFLFLTYVISSAAILLLIIQANIYRKKIADSI